MHKKITITALLIVALLLAAASPATACPNPGPLYSAPSGCKRVAAHGYRHLPLGTAAVQVWSLSMRAHLQSRTTSTPNCVAGSQYFWWRTRYAALWNGCARRIDNYSARGIYVFYWKLS